MFNVGDVFKCRFSLVQKSFKHQIITKITDKNVVFYRNDRKTYVVDLSLLKKIITVGNDESYKFVGNMKLIDFYEKYSKK